jgi:uncharacterized protein (TIGR02271 family)
MPARHPRGRADRDEGEPLETYRHEEELRVDTELIEAGTVRIRKEVADEESHRIVPRAIERADVERVTVDDEQSQHDTGEVETLPDGSISIPVFEEELVVTKRVVVRERIVIRKHTVVEEQPVSATLRRERIAVDTDEEVADRVRSPGEE